MVREVGVGAVCSRFCSRRLKMRETWLLETSGSTLARHQIGISNKGSNKKISGSRSWSRLDILMPGVFPFDRRCTRFKMEALPFATRERKGAKLLMSRWGGVRS